MDAVTLFWTAFLAFLPISELRGAIPFAIARGMDWRWAFLYAVALNALVAPACWLFLSTFHKLFLRMKLVSCAFRSVRGAGPRQSP